MKYLLNNFWIKVLSIFIAIFLFLLVRSDRETTFTRTAQITFVPEEGMVVVGENPMTIPVDIRLMNTLFAFPPTEKQLEAKVLLKSNSPGKYNVVLKREEFNNLPPYYLLSFAQSTIDVELDELGQAQVPVRVVFEEDTLPKDLVIRHLKQSVQKVIISGPKKAVTSVRFLDTLPIPIPQNSGEYSINTALNKEKFLQNYASSVTADPAAIDVSFTLTPAPQLRTFRAVPIGMEGKLKSARSYFEIRPNTVDVSIAGSPEVLTSLTPDDVRVFVKAGTLKVGWNEVPLNVDVPKGVHVEKIQPDQISVFVSNTQ